MFHRHRLPQRLTASPRYTLRHGQPYPNQRRFKSIGARKHPNSSNDSLRDAAPLVDRNSLEKILKRNLFYTPSFEIYQGVGTKGLYDYGPPGCALHRNIIDLWRRHFVFAEDMLEIDGTSVIPSEVLQTSGHVDKFVDWVTQDRKTGEILRVDHVIKAVIQSRLRDDDEARKPRILSADEVRENILPSTTVLANKVLSEDMKQQYQAILTRLDSCDGEELSRLMHVHTITNPSTGNLLKKPRPFNLMFRTKLGPLSGSTSSAYLRPETAQSQFVNVQKLFHYGQNALPFASASVGKAYRNEISPRSGLLRTREFSIAEIEHYLDPASEKKHCRFDQVADVDVSLLSSSTQLEGRENLMKIKSGDAVARGIIDNETLGYFLARTQLFLQQVGVQPQKLRFRQHMLNERAHYASDCWDAEVLTTYGWIECVGVADRAVFDLTAHENRTGHSLSVQETLKEAEAVQECVVNVRPREFGLTFKKNSPIIKKALEDLSQAELEEMRAELDTKGTTSITVPHVSKDDPITLTKDLMTVERRETTRKHRSFTPAVIEPSFGISRIFYALLEHIYWTRTNHSLRTARSILSFPMALAPCKVLICPLTASPDCIRIVDDLRNELKSATIPVKVDASGASIGKRYARADEVGTPLGITVDFQSLSDGSVTLRERDSMVQVRASKGEILDAVRAMVAERESWEDVSARLPRFVGQEVE